MIPGGIDEVADDSPEEEDGHGERFRSDFVPLRFLCKTRFVTLL